MPATSGGECFYTKPKLIEFNGREGGCRTYQCGPCFGICRPNRHTFLAIDADLNESAAVTHIMVSYNLVKPSYKRVMDSYSF